MSTPSLLNIPYLYKAGTLYSQIPESGAGDFTVQRTTTVANRSTRINKDGFIETVLDNVPRLDYPLGGAVNGCPALLVEPSATNGIRNNSMVGAVAGSPGTLPTNWTNSGSTLTRQSIATGTLNGIPYVDIRISGTATNVFHDVFWESSNVIAASVGQDWVASCYLQIIAQPNPPFSYNLAMREFNSSGGFLGFFQGAALSISTTSFNRFSFARVLNQATVAFVQPSLFFALVNGQYYDFTIRIGYPQMERGTVATSVIPTTTAAVTRSADVITNTAASALIGQSEGTIYLEVDAPSASSQFFRINVAVTNAIHIYKNASDRYQVRIYPSASSIDLTDTSAKSGFVKIAIAYKSGESALVINGGTPITSATAYSFSAALNTINFLGGVEPVRPTRIRAVELYPNRLTNAQLATLTAL